MNRIIKAEIYKLFHNKTIIFTILASLVLGAMVYFLPDFYKGQDTLGLIASTISDAMAFIAIVAGAAICTDIQDKTLKNIVLSGVSRTKIYIGRLIAVILMSSFVLTLAMISRAVGATLLSGIESVTEAQVPLLLEAIGLQFVIMIGVVSVVFLIASIIKNLSYSLMASLLLINGTPMLFPYLKSKFNLDLASFDITSLMDSIGKLKINGDVIIHVAIITGVVVVITNFIGTMIFKRTDI